MDFFAAIARSAQKAVSFVGARQLDRAKRALVLERASASMQTPVNSQILEKLNPESLEELNAFCGSPEFDHIVLQAVLAHHSDDPETAHTAVRSELRAVLRHRVTLAGFDLTEVTDLVYSGARAAASTSAPRSSASALSQTFLQDASVLAAAAAANSELLNRIAKLDSIEAFANQLRQQTHAHFSKFRLPSITGTLNVKRSDLYVDARLGIGQPTDLELSHSDALKQYLHIVALGDPGAGKSSLVGQLAFELSRPATRLTPARVPIVVILRDHLQKLLDGGEPLLTYLIDSCRVPHNLEPPADALDYLLRNGRITVILDGIDELGDAEAREKFNAIVEGFARLYPFVPVIATSRLVGYSEASLDDQLFQRLRVLPFARSQRELYVKRRFRLAADMAAHERDDLAELFLSQLDEIPDLGSNPLMLSLLCELFRSERTIPENRPDIYRKCAEVLFDQWDRSRGISVAYKFGSQLRPSVMKLAWRIFTDDERRQSLPEDEVVEFLAAEVMRSRFSDEDEAGEAAAEFLHFCAGRAWVLTKFGNDELRPRYGFTHKTFLEYFASLEVVRKQPSSEQVWNKLRDHLGDSGWQVVVQLAIQILEQTCDGGADGWLGLAAKDGSVAAVSQACQALSWHVPDNDVLDSLVRSAVLLACAVSPEERFGVSAERVPEHFDAPLMFLLRTPVAQNQSRVARLVAACIAALSADEGEGFGSAPLLWAFMMDDRPIVGTDEVWAVLQSELTGHATMPAVEMWRRRLIPQHPSDIDNCGDWLVADFTLGNITRMSRSLSCMLALSEGGPYFEEYSSRLEELYPLLSGSSLPQFDREDVSIWGHAITSLRLDKLSALSEDARGSVAILLVAVLPHMGRTVFDDADLARIHGAPDNPALREAALLTINGLGLPQVAHSLMAEYCLGNQAVGGRL